MNKPFPLVSIITPSFNQGKYIEATIQSIKYQDYPGIEHLVIDGDSTDNTREILKKNTSQQMKFISEPDHGQVEALQKGFAICQGEILTWLNSDDIYLSPTVISRVVSLFNSYPAVHIVTGGGMELSPEGKWTRQIEAVPQYVNTKHLRYVDSVFQPATFFRRIVIETIQPDASLNYAFDWTFFFQCSLHYNFLTVNEPWAGSRIWKASKTQSGGLARVRELREVTKSYLGRGSWQYIILNIYCFLTRLADAMSPSIQNRLTRLLHNISYWLMVSTKYRITSI